MTDRDKVIRELHEWNESTGALAGSWLSEVEALVERAYTAGVKAERTRQRDYYDRIAGICAEGQRDMNPEKYKR